MLFEKCVAVTASIGTDTSWQWVLHNVDRRLQTKHRVQTKALIHRKVKRLNNNIYIYMYIWNESDYWRWNVQPTTEFLVFKFLTCDQQAVGSNPGCRTAQCNPGQVVYICDSVTKQYNLVPVNGRWRLVAGEVTAGLAESNGSLPLGFWLWSPAGWLQRTGISSGTLRSFWVWDLSLSCSHTWNLCNHTTRQQWQVKHDLCKLE